MAKYMVQTMRAGTHQPVTYYRKQSHHPSHGESTNFTKDAKNAYAARVNVNVDTVEAGKYQSDQGVPSDPGAVKI
ncbi:hypothetical protein [Actinomadura sp. 7K507]|uniref:hypothetical protein n=1 Tax=Actinomadura sp. 7K507 TaxID=2530365 RepID=UPI00104E0B1E|nr:hypothetical protein [Actinomadura sp. 7K507]TDC88559.1 hypothetical protein E1285_18190 [Actinomadura sp. 7K507]